jgi:7-cyano-7-deazaguanine synthase in queuosine biosynthesis
MKLNYEPVWPEKYREVKGKRVLLYSGGVDSECIRRLWRPDVLLYVDMQTEYSETELSRIKNNEIKGEVTVVKLPLTDWEDSYTKYIPSRNLMLLTVAAEFGETLCLGATKDDIANDKTMEFLNVAEQVLNLTHTQQTNSSGRKIYVEKDFKQMSKVELLQACAHSRPEVLLELWENTFSCYTPNDRVLIRDHSCWGCKPCMRKALAFMAAGFELPPEAIHGIGVYIAYKGIRCDVEAGRYHKPEEAELIKQFQLKYKEELKDLPTDGEIGRMFLAD